MDYIIYLIVNNSNNCTYVGITNNPERRIRQHNGDLVGGAKYTKNKKNNGTWSYYGFILGCEKHEALSIEKKIHIHSKKTYGKTPLEKRINCINKLLLENEHLFFTVL